MHNHETPLRLDTQSAYAVLPSDFFLLAHLEVNDVATNDDFSSCGDIVGLN